MRQTFLLLILLFPKQVSGFIPRLIPQKAQVKEASRVSASDTSTEASTTTDTSPYHVLFQADKTVDAPLPPSYTECPFTGIMSGPKSFYRQASSKLRAPSLFSFLHKNQPMAEVSGGNLVRQLLRQEFTSLSSNAVAGISQKVCGTKSLRTARDRQEHHVLRQLVGVPLSNQAVERSIPRLEAIGRFRINERVRAGEEIIAWDMTLAMALDMTWQQLLGLNLETPEEIATFHEETRTWLKGMWFKEGSREFEACMKSKEHLRAAIDKKINQLLEDGQSDGSTVGGLVFATMDDVQDGSSNDVPPDRTLSQEEIIDNCLLLILAGTETTATNVANALLLMGLHPEEWQNVIEEQGALVAQYGETLTAEILQACPYLDAVIHEMMRLLPVTLVSRRVTTKTIVLDGFQVPEGWGISYNMYLTHEQDPSTEEGHMDLLKGFKPERWLDPTTKPSRDYIPFGAGPRQCPGSFLALTEMKTFLSLLAREMPNFELSHMDYDSNKPLDEQIQWNRVSSLITPEDGVRIKVLPSERA